MNNERQGTIIYNRALIGPMVAVAARNAATASFTISLTMLTAGYTTHNQT
jgi:hypothetical protein